MVSNISDFSEVISNDFNLETTGDTTPQFKQLNALYWEKLRKQRDNSGKPNQSSPYSTFRPILSVTQPEDQD